MCVGMGTKNISISEEAYRRLASLKHENESFSLVITRLTGKISLTNIFGVLTSKEADCLERNDKNVRHERHKVEKNRRQKLQEAFE